MTSDIDALKKDYENFAYIVSHDLGAPIRQAKSFLSLLVEDMEDLNEDQKTCRDMIVKSLDNADNMIAGLLRLSRLDRHEIKLKSCDITSYLNNHYPDITIKTLPKILKADEKLLHILIEEIMDNAIKFQSPDRPISINIFANSNDTHTVINITDNGQGIEADYIKRAFVPLQVLHPKNAYEGCGIGLSLCKKIMILHGGTIEIQPNTDHGLTVTLSFPN